MGLKVSYRDFYYVAKRWLLLAANTSVTSDKCEWRTKRKHTAAIAVLVKDVFRISQSTLSDDSYQRKKQKKVYKKQ